MNGDLAATSAALPFRRSRGDRPTKVRAHEGEEDGLKVATGGRVRENTRGERGAVDAAVGCKYGRSEARDDGGHSRTARCFQFVDNIVCVNNMNAKFPKKLGKQAFAAGDSACQSYLHNNQLAGAGVTPASGCSGAVPASSPVPRVI